MVARLAGNEKWTLPYPAAASLLARVLFDMLARLCRSAEIASMAGGTTTGYRRCVPDAEARVRIVHFAFKNISKVGSAGSAVIRDARAASMCR